MAPVARGLEVRDRVGKLAIRAEFLPQEKVSNCSSVLVVFSIDFHLTNFERTVKEYLVWS